MELTDVKTVYLLGIGGIGMSALARFFAANGADVSGYDKTKTPLCAQLEQEGIRIHYDLEPEHLNLDAELFIYTPAIKPSNKLFQYALDHGKIWRKRSAVLEKLTSVIDTIAVGGTHGKTTTSALVTHVLHHAGHEVSGFVGGIMNNYHSNLVACPDPGIMVVEADEYDRSFLRLKPKIAVVTSLEADHLDIYGSLDELKSDFDKFAATSERLILHESLATQFNHPNALLYGFAESADVRATNIRVANHRFEFDVTYLGKSLGSFHSTLPGRHNIENTLASITVALLMETDVLKVKEALASFTGVYRRFERADLETGIALIDDYAHHPTELIAAISAARELYPDRKITVVFQPHLYSRTRDLEAGFVDALNQSDEAILLPIYPAREAPIDGISSLNLLNKLSLKTKQLVEKTHLVNAVLSLSPETVLMLGAGDIDQMVKPVADALGIKQNVE